MCDFHRALTDLRTWFSPGDTVYTITRHISRTGMQAKLSVVIFRDGRSLHPTWSVSKVTSIPASRVDGFGALVVRGCGFDRGQSIVDAISYALWGQAGQLKHESL